MSSSMSSRFSIIFATLVVSLFFSSVPTTRAQQKPLTADQEQIVDTVSTIFAAVRGRRRCEVRLCRPSFHQVE
jgi:hypothetical protein